VPLVASLRVMSVSLLARFLVRGFLDGPGGLLLTAGLCPGGRVLLLSLAGVLGRCPVRGRSGSS